MKHRVGVRRRDTHPSQPQTCVCHPPSRCGPRCRRCRHAGTLQATPSPARPARADSSTTLHRTGLFTAAAVSHIVSSARQKTRTYFHQLFRSQHGPCLPDPFFELQPYLGAKVYLHKQTCFILFDTSVIQWTGEGSPLPTSSFISPATIRK